MENRVELRVPQFEEMAFRQSLLADPDTMSYNAAYGGTIDFAPSRWPQWYEKWLGSASDGRFYRYIYACDLNTYVGETAWHFEAGVCLCDVLVAHRFRGRGYGSEALRLLCREAKARSIPRLYDDIAAGNPSLNLFLRYGFRVERVSDEAVRVCIDL